MANIGFRMGGGVRSRDRVVITSRGSTRTRKRSARHERAWKCLGADEDDMARECERAENGGFLPLRVATFKGETVYGMIRVLHLINEGVLEGLNGLDFERGCFYILHN
jgi:hypothetical protein